MSAEGEQVSLPHTWNALEGQDGGNDYYRGTCWYRLALEKPVLRSGEKAYLEFDGAAMTAEVYLNEEKLSIHEGGYSRFRVDITDKIRKSGNELLVSVDNSDNDRIYPQKADFTFYGGLYRMVRMVIVPKSHFSMDYYGSSGIKVTPVVALGSGQDKASAEVTVEVYTEGGNSVSVTIGDETKQEKVIDGYARVEFELPEVYLWDGVDDPYLYTARAELDSGDEVTVKFGCRHFSIDPQKGFFLNGRYYPLRGVSRHQDYKGVGNALKLEHHKRDMEIIREIGANRYRCL